MKTKQIELLVLIVSIAMVAFSAVMLFVLDDPEWSSRTNFILAVAFAIYIGYVSMSEKSAEKRVQKRDEQIESLNTSLQATKDELSKEQNKSKLLADQLAESQNQVGLLQSEVESISTAYTQQINALNEELAKHKSSEQ